MLVLSAASRTSAGMKILFFKLTRTPSGVEVSLRLCLVTVRLRLMTGKLIFRTRLYIIFL